MCSFGINNKLIAFIWKISGTLLNALRVIGETLLSMQGLLVLFAIEVKLELLLLVLGHEGRLAIGLSVAQATRQNCLCWLG